MAEAKVVVEVDGQRLTLSNLAKVLYPDAEFTKRDVIAYYQAVAPLLVPHVRDRAATFVRFPNGVAKPSFFEKNVSRHAPEWVRTAHLTTRSNERREVNDYPVIDSLATLVWAANLAALELHVPQWKLGAQDVRLPPDLLVFDLDPGAPADIVDCCALALRLRDALAADGLTAYPKTSGSKGMQLYCPIRTDDPLAPSRYAKALAERLAAQRPDEVVSQMTKALRTGKVLIDWSQNNPAKTTIAPYSLRGKENPTVSTPIEWAEVEACRAAEELRFTAADVLARVSDGVDPMAGALSGGADLP